MGRNSVFQRPCDGSQTFSPSSCVQAGLCLVQVKLPLVLSKSQRSKLQKATQPPFAGHRCLALASPLHCTHGYI